MRLDRSDKGAARSAAAGAGGAGHGLVALLEYCAHGLIENSLESLLGEGAALEIAGVGAVLFDILASCLGLNRGCLGVGVDEGVLGPLVNLVADEYLGDIGANCAVEFGVPLGEGEGTFL